jgi:hypothetical protein
MSQHAARNVFQNRPGKVVALGLLAQQRGRPFIIYIHGEALITQAHQINRMFL